MFPIIKIRLIYVKRNLIKNIFSFGYPILVIFFFTYILNNSDKFELYPTPQNNNIKNKSQKNINTKKIDTNEPHKHFSSYFNLFDAGEIKLITDGDVGIIYIKNLWPFHTVKNLENLFWNNLMILFDKKYIFEKDIV